MSVKVNFCGKLASDSNPQVLNDQKGAMGGATLAGLSPNRIPLVAPNPPFSHRAMPPPFPPPLIQVRLEFLLVLGDWMLHLNERMDHEQRLMPYLLSALNDDNPQIRVGVAQSRCFLRLVTLTLDRGSG